MKRRTMTILVVKANDPDEIDGQGFDERRHDGMGWNKSDLLHPGEPDVLVRRALDLATRASTAQSPGGIGRIVASCRRPSSLLATSRTQRRS